MTDKEQIKEIVKKVLKERTDIIRIPDLAKPISEDLYNAGYHKTIWHKVADGDLPPANKDIIFYAYMPSGSCYYDIGVYSHFVKLWYGNSCGTTNDRVIAWAELPEYKE